MRAMLFLSFLAVGCLFADASSSSHRALKQTPDNQYAPPADGSQPPPSIQPGTPEQQRCKPEQIPADPNCAPNCIGCTSGMCFGCQPGFYIEYNSGKCLECPEGCLACVSPEICECCDSDNGWKLIKDPHTSVCKKGSAQTHESQPTQPSMPGIPSAPTTPTTSGSNASPPATQHTVTPAPEGSEPNTPTPTTPGSTASPPTVLDGEPPSPEAPKTETLRITPPGPPKTETLRITPPSNSGAPKPGALLEAKDNEVPPFTPDGRCCEIVIGSHIFPPKEFRECAKFKDTCAFCRDDDQQGVTCHENVDETNTCCQNISGQAPPFSILPIPIQADKCIAKAQAGDPNTCKSCIANIAMQISCDDNNPNPGGNQGGVIPGIPGGFGQIPGLGDFFPGR